MRFEIICVLWGQNYCDVFTNYCLPSLLAPDNLPNWPWPQTTTFVLYTTNQDFARLQAAPLFKKLTQLLSIEVRLIETWLESKDKLVYGAMTLAHQDAIQKGIKSQSHLIMLAPDVIFSNQSFLHLGDCVKANKKLVLVVGPRACIETAESEIKTHITSKYLSLSTQECVSIWCNHMHDYSQGHFWDNERIFNYFTAQVNEWGENHTININHFFPHPFYLQYPYQPYDPSYSTIDGLYLSYYEAFKDEVEFIQDDRFFLMSLTPQNDTSNYLIQSPDLLQKQIQLDLFYRSQTAPFQQWLFNQPITLQVSPEMAHPPCLKSSQALKAVQWFWTIEAWYYQKNFAEIIHSYQQSSHLLDALHSKVFGSVYYFIASAFSKEHLIDPLKDFLKTYHLQMTQYLNISDTSSLLEYLISHSD